jgi:hypothetical protein
MIMTKTIDISIPKYILPIIKKRENNEPLTKTELFHYENFLCDVDFVAADCISIPKPFDF